MAENLFKVFFIISYESNFPKKFNYSLSNKDGIDNLQIIYTKKFKNDENRKDYAVSVFSFDINNPKEKDRDEKTKLFKEIINFTIQNDVYEQQLLFKEGKYNFIYNFVIENNPSFIKLGQSTQLKVYFEVIKEQKQNYKGDLLKGLILDSINFLNENKAINFNFFLELLKLCYLNEERNLVLLNFQLEKIKFINNFNSKDYTSILSIIKKNPAKFCKENDNEEKEKINEKFCLILICLIINYEKEEKIKLQKLDKLISDNKEYYARAIVLYTQYHSNIKIPEYYICDILMNINLTYEIIKRMLNLLSFNTKRIEIINKCRDSICEYCQKNDKILKMIELAPPQKDDNIEEMIYQITPLINYQRKKNFCFLLFEQEYWERYCKYNKTAENLMLINNIISLYQNIDKNLKTIELFNNSSTPCGNRNKNSKEAFKDFVDLKQIQKRLIMPTIGNISVGKSFFLNSILGNDFCQVKSEITTKFILFLRHIDNLKEPRLYKLEPLKRDDSYDFFYNYKEVYTGEENIKNKINEINDENKNSKVPIFYMLEIEIKSIENKEFLNKFDFLDVPGLNESGEDYIDLYFEYIKDMIKYCLIIFSAEKYNSKDSMEIIKNLKKKLYVPIENFLIILNKIDVVNDLEKTIRDFKKVVLNDGNFNIYKNTLVPVNSLKLKSEIQIKDKFYDFINYYYMEYNKNKKDEERYIDFIKKIMMDKKKKLDNFDEIIKKMNNINDDEKNKIKSNFKKIEKEKKDKGDNIIFDFEDKNEMKIFKLFYIFFKEKLIIPEVSKAIIDINNYFNNIKDYDFPNKNFDSNIKKEKEFIYDNSDEYEILKSLDEFFKEIFISESLKNYGNIVPILKEDFKILKNYIFNSNLNYIPILGASNSGKSSIINCLLGKNILPSDSSECTRRAIIIRYLDEIEKTSLYSIKFNRCENLNEIYYYYTKEELISENLDEIKEIISILNETFPPKQEDSFLLLETNIKFLENPKIEKEMKKRDICFIDFPGHNTNNNSFFDNNIYQKVLKMSSFFVYINSGKAFKDDSNKSLLSSIYKDVINIRQGDITSKQFIELCLFIFNKVDILEEKERNLNNINKEIKDTLEIDGDVDEISCSFFSSKLYKQYLSKIEEYKINEVIKLFKKFLVLFNSQGNDDLFDDREESFIKFSEDNLKSKIKSDYPPEEIDLTNINEGEITSSDIYREINTYLDKFYEENNLNKEENYNEILQNICKYLIFCNKNNNKLNLYKQSYASDTLKIMIEKILKSYSLKKAEYNNHLEKFLSFLNIFFGMEEGFNVNGKNNFDELKQTSLNNVEQFFKDFKGNELIENCQTIILDYIKNNQNSFAELMKNHNNDVNQIIKTLQQNINDEMIAFKKYLIDELNKLEKNIGDELNKIGTEMISINKNVTSSLSAKDKLFYSISFCTLGIGAVAYGLFYKLPNLIINAVSEERKFQQFIEQIEEDIKNEFKGFKDSIQNNIKSYKNRVTQNIERFFGIIRAGKIKNDENWKNAKEKYQIIYNKYKSLKNNK